jgi:hypothetical protein
MTQGRLSNAVALVVELVVVVLCIPFYLVAPPLILLSEWFAQRRRVRLGLEVSHSTYRDVSDDFLVVDVSRVDEGLVGIRRRHWNTLIAFRTGSPPPPYGETVEFIPIARFWVPEPFKLRGRRSASEG